MTCQHSNCSFHIFSLCTNHCMKNVCLKHLIEHGDIFLNDYTNLLNDLDKSTNILMKEINLSKTQIIQRRNYEIELINRKYDDEQQKIQKQLIFAETANNFYKDKQEKVFNSKEKNECFIAQHDFEQLKSYIKQINKSFPEKSNNINTKTYSCPLIKPNVFGITNLHNIRFDCDGTQCSKFNLLKHFEHYHRILPDYALRLRNAYCDDQISDQIKLFSENDILFNNEFLMDCPLTNSKNIYGAHLYINTLMHIPCTKKQLTIPALINHFTLYHKMKYEIAKQIFQKIKSKTLHSDLILFEHDQRLVGNFRKK